MTTTAEKIRLNIRITPKAEAQLEELQRILSERLGTRITKTGAIEIAIDRLLDTYKTNPEQARLI